MNGKIFNKIMRKVTQTAKAGCALALVLTWGVTESFAAPIFYSTSDTSHWQVATNVSGGSGDGLFSSFPTTGFTTATAITARPGWIANNSTGTNGGRIGNWTFFVFRQTFDLTGYDATTADLKFQWAADDSGQGFAARGTWTPKFSLNGGALIGGAWPGGNTYDFGPTVDLNSGFISGLNTIDFYVEGNGVTDGFALTLSNGGGLTAAIPEASTYVMMLAGLGILGIAGLRRKKA